MTPLFPRGRNHFNIWALPKKAEEANMGSKLGAAWARHRWGDDASEDGEGFAANDGLLHQEFGEIRQQSSKNHR